MASINVIKFGPHGLSVFFWATLYNTILIKFTLDLELFDVFEFLPLFWIIFIDGILSADQLFERRGDPLLISWESLTR